MERLKFPKDGVQILVCVILFIILQHTSPVYTTQTPYFISCGSTKDNNFTGRLFLNDSNSGSFRHIKKGSTILEISNKQSNVTQLYQSARIFRQANSYYVFNIDDQGIHIVRLHFLPFPSSTNLSSAVFDVSVPGLTLLHSFSVPNSTTTPIVKEFMLKINNTKFAVYFNPRASSFAFVNAIEVVLAPNNSIPDSAQNVNTSGNGSNYSGILSKVLQTKYRLNVGDSEIDPSDDKLWRTWEPDDKYMISDANTSFDDHSGVFPKYTDDVTEYIAPATVYQTARAMETNSSNTTWGFNVNVSSRHMVRTHFCDFVSKSPDTLLFNLYIFDNFHEEINSFDFGELGVPFKFDFVVLSDTFGKINVGIGAGSYDSTPNDSIPDAYLNGLEIMEIMGDWNSSFNFTGDEGSDSHVVVIVGVAIGGFVLLCTLIFAVVIILKCRKPKPTETSNWSPLRALGFGGGSSHSKTTDPSVKESTLPHIQLGLKIPLLEIQSATNNFHASLMVGEGGFGNVYRGTLKNGEIVAVKRSKAGAGQGFLEFHTEITVLSKIRHRHLVSLIGYCTENNEMILVYEFMEKGSLKDHLYNTEFPPLSWKQRLEICIGAAKGLTYLHRGAAGGIIHRDVKSTNILLDANFLAKVADFGLSKFGPVDQNQTHVSTNVKGTFGYLDPEYFETQQLTEKSDVYSFGVVLLEVLCARPAINPTLPREEMNLAEWGMHCIHEGMLETIVDPTLAGQINPNSLRKFGEIAAKCLQHEVEDRPIMADVLWDLEYALQLQQTAVQPPMNMESTLDPSSVITMSDVQRFPSFSMSFVGDHAPPPTNDNSDMPRDEVFSQLNFDEAR